MTTIQAVYERGVLRPKRRLALRNHEVVILRLIRKPDPIEGTRGIIEVSRQFVRELTRPHRYSLVDP